MKTLLLGTEDVCSLVYYANLFLGILLLEEEGVSQSVGRLEQPRIKRARDSSLPTDAPQNADAWIELARYKTLWAVCLTDSASVSSYVFLHLYEFMNVLFSSEFSESTNQSVNLMLSLEYLAASLEQLLI